MSFIHKKLDPEFKKQYLKALRSGEYIQSEEALVKFKNNQEEIEIEILGYCCLGVACKVAGASNKELSGLGYIRKELIEKYPILIPISGGDNSDIAMSLTKANDVKHWDFNRIANIIERIL